MTAMQVKSSIKRYSAAFLSLFLLPSLLHSLPFFTPMEESLIHSFESKYGRLPSDIDKKAFNIILSYVQDIVLVSLL